jgi:sulfur-oxidizing protein SoxY
MKRRIFLLAAGAAALGVPGRGAHADAVQEAVRHVLGAARPREGKVTLDLPPLVENGNTVPMTVRVASPMTREDHVRAIHVFNEKNPQPRVGSFHLGPRAGRAAVSTRIRLADSQTVTALAQMSDGSWWSGTAQVIVTLAACTETI